MASRRMRSNSIETNYLPSGLNLRSESKGTQLVREPTSVLDIFLTVFLYGCRKYLFFSTHKRLFIYFILLVSSIMGDYINVPKIYFANSGTFLNQYFVKLGWFWTILWTSLFLFTSSSVFCINSKGNIMKHSSRLFIATFFWWFWTNGFNYFGQFYGSCTEKGLSRNNCLSAGKIWQAFDISGHVFILIYSTLVMISEARPIIGWDKIHDVIIAENNARISGKKGKLNYLNENELIELKSAYINMTPFIKLLFLIIALFVAIWELMLLTTMMYFHRMPEKLLAGFIAMFTWFLTYRLWYPSEFLPLLPGQGFFNYQALQRSELS
ncbi:acyl-coenzyme A diphosphatase FITM2-like [Daktulosphaira vitifoliae]|uniref:acyl-coenzyme A diphosphatase FITM2-like n=1 Tax=Daktulosphaira vitifoliae TaxID=58002 RepID=UPI0021AAACCA|nr:acyl-coenzyme A diphosphatase FITM2-like [Daktulosphaira vitifoliae]XP_050543822.1 acyl-coenzyme A diphosphatase FITM2-like [Daktulosphaira vitifoliae]